MLYSHLGSTVRAWAVVLLVLLLPLQPSIAADGAAPSSEIEMLKQQIIDLQRRVERLEGEVEQGLPVNMARKVKPVPGGWRKAHNWKLLEEGMSDYEVIEILGEPDREKTVKKFDFWYYGDGKLSVYMRRLKGWDIPSGIESE